MDTRLYGAPALFTTPLLDDADAKLFLTAAPTIAAGDVKFYSDAQIAANPTAKILGFDSMDAEPAVGTAITENGGDGTGTVMAVVIVSGTVGGGDAAGFMFLDAVTGTWTDNATIDMSGDTDFATVDAGTTGVYTLAANQIANTAGLFAFANKRAYVCLTSTEMSCAYGDIDIIDAADGPDYYAQALQFATYGHESAMDPQGCVLTTTLVAGDDGAQTTTNIRLNDPSTTLRVGFFFEVVDGTGEGQCGYIKTYSGAANYDVVPYVALDTALEGTTSPSIIKFYRDAKRVPAHVVVNEGTITPGPRW